MRSANRERVQGASKRRQCRFGGCDITRPVNDPSNGHLADVLPTTSSSSLYVVAENAIRLEASGFEFFETLFKEAADGTVLLSRDDA